MRCEQENQLFGWQYSCAALWLNGQTN